MRTLALILARAGSKGVPHKNRALVAGRPCVLWTIDDARESKLLSRIALTTDDPEIQKLALETGVDTIARPAELATETATIDDAARHALTTLDEPFDAVVILYANVPVRPAALIDRAINTLAQTSAHSVQSYTTVGKHHPLWTARLNPDTHEVTPWQGDTLNNNIHRRQDLPPAFIPDGAVLAVTTPALSLELPGIPPGPHAFLGSDRRGIETPENSVVDIDTPTDLLVAEALLRERTAGALP